MRYNYGVTFPIEQEEFRNDTGLLRKVNQLSDLVEIRNDFRMILETYKVLQASLEKRVNLELPIADFSVHVEDLSEMIFTHLLMTYTKAFMSSNGATNLADKKESIFSDVAMHEHFMALRSKHYAHRDMKGNSKRIRVWPNRPRHGEIEIDVDSLSSRWGVARSPSTRIEGFEVCALEVMGYLEKQIQGLKTATEGILTDKQRKYICTERREVIQDKYGGDELYFEPKMNRITTEKSDDT